MQLQLNMHTITRTLPSRQIRMDHLINALRSGLRSPVCVLKVRKGVLFTMLLLLLLLLLSLIGSVRVVC